jgi:hypothetical protein
MPSKQKTSATDDFLHLMSRLPWWACLATAAVAYLLPQSYAVRPPVA